VVSLSARPAPPHPIPIVNHPHHSATTIAGATEVGGHGQRQRLPAVTVHPQISVGAINAVLNLATAVNFAAPVPLAPIPSEWYLIHYNEERNTGVGQRTRYRLKPTQEAREYAALWGASDSGFEIIHATKCGPFCCHNKKYKLDNPRLQHHHTQGLAHGNTIYPLCCEQAPDNLRRRKRKNCSTCMERNARRGTTQKEGSSGGKAAAEEKAPVRGRGLDDPNAAGKATKMNNRVCTESLNNPNNRNHPANCNPSNSTNATLTCIAQVLLNPCTNPNTRVGRARRGSAE
jgi:hypothetical protein